MKIVCLDFEGVLVPDIWPQVAKATQIAALNLTTRDVKNYRELMERRVEICHQNGIDLRKIQTLIGRMEPLPGAVEFAHWIRERCQLILLTDSYYEFIDHFMKLFGRPAVFCHSIGYNPKTARLEFNLRQDNQKAEAVKALRSLNFQVFAAGDSYNDVTMLQEAHHAALFNAPPSVAAEFPQYPHLHSYEEMKAEISAKLGL